MVKKEKDAIFWEKFFKEEAHRKQLDAVQPFNLKAQY